MSGPAHMPRVSAEMGNLYLTPVPLVVSSPPLSQSNAHFPDLLVLEVMLSENASVTAITEPKACIVMKRMTFLAAQQVANKRIDSKDLNFEGVVHYIVTEILPRERLDMVSVNMQKLAQVLQRALTECAQARTLAMSESAHFPGSGELNRILSSQAQTITHPKEKEAMEYMISLAARRLASAPIIQDQVIATIDQIIGQLKKTSKLSEKQWRRLAMVLEKALMSCQGRVEKSATEC